MEIEYKSKKLQKVCTIAHVAEKSYGMEIADKIFQRIQEISAADSVEAMIRFHIGRCHPLTGNRRGQYAVDLVHPYRLVFKKKDHTIEIVVIQEIVDYH